MKNLKKAIALIISIVMILSIMPVNAVWASELIPDVSDPVVTLDEGENDCPHEGTRIFDYIEPSCVTDGYSGDKRCSLCGYLIATGTVLPAVEHDFRSMETFSDFCFLQENVKMCTKCGEINTSLDIQGGRHNLSAAIKTVTTCTLGTFELKDCADCGLTVAELVDDTSAGHSFVSGVCTECGISENSGYEYYFAERWGGLLINRFTGDAKNVAVPSEIEGIPVRVLGSSSFRNCDATSVSVPDTVIQIDSWAFSECRNLKEVTLGSNVVSLGAGVFSYCDILQKVTINSSLHYIPFKCFECCEFLDTVNLPAGLSFISDEAFKDTALEEIDIPDSVYSIGMRAFRGCWGFTEIKLPENLEFLGAQAFSSCWNIEKLTMGDNLEVIGTGAFEQVYGLTYVDFSDSLREIKSNAFMGCGNFSYAVLPASLESIGNQAFWCGPLWHVWYAGSEEDFSNVKIADGNYGIEEAVIHYGYLAPTITTQVIAPTCEQEGYTKLICTLCQDDSFGEIDYTERIPHSEENAEMLEYFDATCMQGARWWSRCGDCGAMFSIYLSEATGHDYSDPRGYVPPSCNEMAYNLYFCNLCDNFVKEYDYDTNSLGHAITGHETYDTCSWGTVYRYSCSRCDGFFSYGDGGQSHEFNDDGICVNCNSPETILDYEYYIDNAAGGIYITSYYGSAEVISVPAEFEGIPLKVIGGHSFMDKTASKVILPEGLEEIKSYAFTNSMYNEIYIPETVTKIGEGIFSGCEYLEKVNIPDAVTEIPVDTFNWCTSLQSITIPDGVTVIGKRAFQQCESLKEIVIPDGVTEIAEDAFSGCGSLTSVSLPDGIETIGRNAFCCCYSLENIDLPEGITEIGEDAFYACYALEKITLPEGLETISQRVFSSCHRLSLLYIPASVTSIEAGAFEGVLELAHIWYGGSEEDFAAMNISEQPESNFLDATVHFDCESADYEIDETFAPTCQEYGYSVINCALCDESFNGLLKNQVDCYGTEVLETVEATCTTDGYQILRCDTCGNLYEANWVWATGHKMENPVQLPDTCSFSYIEKGLCGTCGENTYSVGEIHYGWHSFVDGVCENCSVIEGLGYYFLHEMSAIVVDSYHGDAEKLVIPAEIEGIPVIGISRIQNESLKEIVISEGIKILDYSAFAFNHNLEKVSLPSTLEIMGENCFEGCIALSEVTLAEGITELPERAFLCCESIEEITLPSTLEKIGEEAFGNCFSLKNIVIPENVEFIGEGAFFGCEGLETVEIKAGITEIAADTFANCESLTDISIPDTVTHIGETAFDSCRSLEEIELPEGLEYIGLRAFAYCERLKSIELPEAITAIECGTFENCQSLESIVIPDSVKTIGEYAFGWCHELSYIEIGSGVEAISPRAFYDCGDVSVIFIPETVTFIGSEAFVSVNPWHVYTAFTAEELEALLNENGNANLFNDYTVIHFEADEAAFTAEAAMESTCIERGYSMLTCELCDEDSGSKTEAGMYLPSVEHNGVYKETVAPTCTDWGYDIYVCADCGTSYERNSTEPAGHQSGEATDFVEGICIIGRYEKSECTVCGEDTFVEVDSEIRGYHNFVDGVCEDCGVADYIEYNFDREYGGIVITGWYDYPEVLEVPASIDGIPVVSIAGGIFNGRSFTEVILPDGLLCISSSVFENCHQLISIEIPDSVTEIGFSAFGNCYALEEVTLPSGLEVIENRLFGDCHSLKEIVIPEGVKEIGDQAFAYCGELTSVSLPSTLEKIGEEAFSCTESLTEIEFPASLEAIGYRAFSYSGLESVEIPATVTQFGEGAFVDCYRLAFVWIGTEVIPVCAFADSAVSFVYLDSGVKEICDGAFSGCAVMHMWTALSAEEYAEVNIAESNYYNLPEAENIHFEADTALYTSSVVRAPTCTQVGVIRVECGCCDMEFTIDTRALSHEYSDEGNQFSTCTFGVATARECKNCGGTFYDFSDSSEGHIPDQDGICTVCGVAVSDFSYNLAGDGSGIEISCYFGDCDELVIPEYIEEIPVTEIAEWAFNGKGFSKVSLPDSLKRIGSGAFYNCSNLVEIEIPDSVKELAGEAFGGCTSLEKVTLPDGITELHNNVFSECKALKEIVIPEGVILIGTNAFAGCEALEKVSLPSTLERIDSCAFSACYSLKEIVIPEGVVSIGSSAFSSCISLETLVLPETLAEMEDHAFESCRSLKEVTLPDSLASIGEYVFAWCYNIEKITLPAGIEEIPEGFLSSNTALSVLEIPEGVRIIGEYAFSNYSALRVLSLPASVEFIGIAALDCWNDVHIFYAGTAEEFESISIAEDNNIFLQENMVIHYGSDLDITLKSKLDADCTHAVAITYVCGVCEDEIFVIEGMATGHNVVDGFCVNCGASYLATIETPHDFYENEADLIWTVHKEGSSFVAVTFHEYTYTEEDYDYVHIYSSDEYIGSYSGDQLAGQRIKVEGDTLVINFTSDSSSNEYYGFKVVKIEFDDETIVIEETNGGDEEEPSTEEPSTEEPSTEEPSTEEPSQPVGCAHADVISCGARKADCYNDGFDSAIYCNDCEQFIEYENYVPALDHDFSAEVMRIEYQLSSGSCTSYASYFRSCTRCGENSNDPENVFYDEKGGYNYNVHEDDVVTLEGAVTATCKTQGYTGDLVYACCGTVSECGESTGFDASNHENAEPERVNVVAATCFSKGYTGDLVYTCCDTLCEEGSKTDIDAENHKELYTYGKCDPSCTAGGYDSLTVCIWCQETIAVENPVDALNHDFTAEVMYIEYQLSSGSCTSYAAYFRSCSRCGENSNDPENIFYDEKGGFFHINTETLGKHEATCTEGGYDSLTYCTDCDAVISVVNPTETSAHEYTERVADDKYLIMPANCTTYALYYCSCVCGAKADNSNDVFYDEDGGYNPESHANPVLTQINTRVATCKTKGYSGDHIYTCCDTVASYGTETDLISSNHEGKADTVKNAVAATCCTPGYTGDIYYSCCDVLYEEGTATGTDASNHETEATKINGVAATCCTPGYTGDDLYLCCKTIVKNGVETGLDATNHESEVTKLVNEKTATCKAEGYTGDLVYECCDALVKKGSSTGVDASNHTGTASVVKNKKAATCTEKGYTGDTYYSCCNALASKGTATPVDASKHTSTQTTTTGAKAATCTEKGYTGDKVYTCCKAVVTKGSAIAATGHKWGAFTTVVEATTENEGRQVRVCSGCKAEESKVIPRIEKIEIAETEQIKVSEALPDVFVADNVTAEDIIEAIPEGAQLVTKEGKPVEADAPVGTGMKIVIMDGDKVVDEKVIVVPFDVDGDAQSTAADARLALRQSVNLESLDDCQKAAADVSDRTDETTVTAADARLILRASVGLEDKDEWFKENL